MSSTFVRLMEEEDIHFITKDFKRLDCVKLEDMFVSYWFEHQEGTRVVWIAYDAQKSLYVGYVTLVWYSKYQPFLNANIPEIKDLNVVPSYRKNGIGSQLLDVAELEAFTRSSIVGIGVGLPFDYGSAQRLYVKRGYIPDGRGLTDYYQHLEYGRRVLVDNLTLWLTKKRE
jgi:GNAT superfamily N-acetyltransferase